MAPPGALRISPAPRKNEGLGGNLCRAAPFVQDELIKFAYVPGPLWIDVKDEQGVRQLITNADWNDDDRRVAFRQISRLAGNCFTEPLLSLR